MHRLRIVGRARRRRPVPRRGPGTGGAGGDHLHVGDDGRPERGRAHARQPDLRLRVDRARLLQARGTRAAFRGAPLPLHAAPVAHVRAGPRRVPAAHDGTDHRLRAAPPGRRPGGGAAHAGLGAVQRAASARPSRGGGPEGARLAGEARGSAATPGAVRGPAVLPAGSDLLARAADVRLAVPPDRFRRGGAAGGRGPVLETQRLSRRSGLRSDRRSSRSPIRSTGGPAASAVHWRSRR